MSSWTYVNGIITVYPMGRTAAETRYILETVLNHLPIVAGSEKCMQIDIVDLGSSSSCSCNEFGESYNRPDLNGEWARWGMFDGGHEYKLVLTGHLRDTVLDETYKSFMKWLVRLAKRCPISDILVEISGNDMYWNNISKLIRYDNLDNLYEHPSWCGDTGFDENGFPLTSNWCEYLMWDSANNSDLPLDIFVHKYYDESADKEYIRRLSYHKNN